MKEVNLSQGKVALVDDADYESVSAFKWSLCRRRRKLYAVRHDNTKPGRPTVLLHRFLLPGVKEVDHEDGNGLNCQRYNLRSATRTQNLQGFQLKRLGCSSSFRGVCWDPESGKWRAQIQVGAKRVRLGRFSSEEDAARAYDRAALERSGEFNCLNFP